MKHEFAIDIARAKNPNYDSMSATAWLMACEREELAKLEALKFKYLRAMDMLRDSIKAHANFLIQCGVAA